MGIYLTDKFSLLHFATGIITYYWGMSFLQLFIIHLLYEYAENTKYGMKLINLIPIWPGGKNKADTIINRLGDQLYALLGWIFAYFFCSIM